MVDLIDAVLAIAITLLDLTLVELGVTPAAGTPMARWTTTIIALEAYPLTYAVMSFCWITHHLFERTELWPAGN